MRFPWRDTSSDIAGGQPPQWETPGGAQAKADKAEEESKKYTDEKNADFTAHVQNTVIHVTQLDKDNWNSKAPGNHTHPNATPTTPGFESAEDKAKLDGIEEGANNYVHPAMHPPSIIAQDTSNRFVTDSEKAAWNAKAETTTATPSAKGLMSAVDKTKLDGIEAGAEVNQNAFATIKAPGQGDVIAGSKQETINFAGGTGITVTTDPAGKKVMITATGEATPGPHASSHVTGGSDVIPDAVTDGASGLMSGSDAKFVRVDGETKAGAQAKVDAVKVEVNNELASINNELATINNTPRAKYYIPDTVITNNTWQKLNFGEKVFDSNEFITTDFTKLTVKEAGTYIINAYIMFSSGAAGLRNVNIARNGVGIGYQTGNVTTTMSYRTQATVISYFDAGDIIELSVFQNSGSDLTVTFANGEGSGIGIVQLAGPT